MLERDQAAIVATLLEGPARLPTDLFAGAWRQVLRAMTVHANTISHARLVALEDTFPRTRAYLGNAEFNRLSRDFLDRGGARGRAHAQIGAGFPDFLAHEAGVIATDLARIEWAWLAAYHAADAPALTLADVAGQGEASLLALPVRLHPAAMMLMLASDAAPILDPALPAGTAALLLTRPEAEVRLLPATPATLALLDAARKIIPLGNLIERLAEQQDGGGAAVVPLIAAGAFERVRR
ncbi:MAG: putative DNA-binding domain-containing protein [Sphingopyxis sp.]|nr:putative DNA-binding domain-containing protein [Sphingopyxis sp.]